MRRRLVRSVGYLGICALGVASGALALGGRAVVSDVQVTARDAGHYVITTRSTEAQAFDVLSPDNARRFTLRLYGANLARTAPLGRLPFGRVRLRARADGNVILRVRLRRGWSAAAVQGRSPHGVEVRVSRGR